MNRIVHNLQTGITEIVELTNEEIAQSQAQYEAWNILQSEETAKEQAKESAKQSALSKLTALGLSEDEIKALLGTT
jgi:hypothetical protein